MWAKAIAKGRCLVPVRAFYESSAIERVPCEKTGRPVRRQYHFRLPGARAFLLAAVQQNGRFSIVTTEPSASVAPIHDRMTLVLGPGESVIWLDPNFARLADRSALGLTFATERRIPEPYRCNRRFCISTKVAQPFTGRCSICRPALDVKVNALLFAEIAHLVGGILIERISILI